MPTFDFRKGTVQFGDADPNWKPQWLIEGMIEKHKINFIAGTAKKANKSAFRRFLLASMLTDQESIFGTFRIAEKPKKVLHLLVEDEADKERTLIDKSLIALAGDVDVEALTRSVAWNDSIGDEDFYLDEEDHLRQLQAFIEEEGIDLLVIDPLQDFSKLEENSSTEQRRLTKKLRRMARRASCTLLIVHHTAKPLQLKGQQAYRSAGDSLRGSNTLGGAAACTTLIERKSPLIRNIRRDCKNYDDSEEIEATLDTDTWLWHAVGSSVKDEVLAYIVAHPGVESRSKVARAIKRSKATVLDAFKHLLDDGQIYEKDGYFPL